MKESLSQGLLHLLFHLWINWSSQKHKTVCFQHRMRQHHTNHDTSTHRFRQFDHMSLLFLLVLRLLLLKPADHRKNTYANNEHHYARDHAIKFLALLSQKPLEMCQSLKKYSRMIHPHSPRLVGSSRFGQGFLPRRKHRRVCRQGQGQTASQATLCL